MVIEDSEDVGPVCKSLSLTRDALEKSLSSDAAFTSLKRSEGVSCGVALELLQLKESKNKSIADL